MYLIHTKLEFFIKGKSLTFYLQLLNHNLDLIGKFGRILIAILVQLVMPSLTNL